MSADPGPTPGQASITTRITTAFAVPGVFVLIAMALHVTANALARRFFGAPFPFSLEVAQYWYLPVVAALGFVIAQLRDDHIVADLLFDRFPRASRRWVTAGGLVLSAVIAGGAACFTLTTALVSLERHKTAGHSPLPSWPAEAIVGLSLGVLAILLVWRAILAIRVHEKQSETDAGLDDEGILQ